ncbi:hypothetical protein RFN28_32075 [Mesorhizobium sp. VK24D]|uniref:Uncharacterized protein n=1 Tax=Mesorhizobium album TaxID=3072314 RepID=A0ABU4Y7Z6_9HYPH|nr:hypothetical protein [Mesorhizobium sp. VK24D]MDX8483058.1 hypothetical protein [Mesorhizobium sp. VK24D]
MGGQPAVIDALFGVFLLSEYVELDAVQAVEHHAVADDAQMVERDPVPRGIELQVDAGALLKAGAVDYSIDRARIVVVAVVAMDDLLVRQQP